MGKLEMEQKLLSLRCNPGQIIAGFSLIGEVFIDKDGQTSLRKKMISATCGL